MAHGTGPSMPPDELARMLDLLTEQVVRYRVDDLCIVYCNRAYASQFKADPDDLIGTPLTGMLNDREMAGLHAQLGRLGPEAPHLRDTEPRPASRTPGMWIEWADRYLPLPTGAEILAVGRDVTERHLAEQRLAASESMFRTLAEASSDLVWRLQVTPEPRLTYVSPSVETLLGWDKERLLGDPEQILHVLDDDGRTAFARALAGDEPPERFDLQFRRPDDTWVTIEMHVARIPGGWQGIGRDVTEMRQMQDGLADLALRDPLTGAANRRLLSMLLDAALTRNAREGTSLVLSYIDLDDFKPVNDVFGHAAGDMVLLEVARRLTSTVRGADIVARIGGDEFVVVHEAEPGAAERILRRLVEVLSPPYLLPDGSEVLCPPSVGAAVSTDHADADDLLAAADEAMYAAKRAHRAARRAHV
ncbi:diguanylate cyclase [Actinotalea sp. M2MS4P-6]|uniref:diguanylate cyclase n=1 Tax=Actinotalea sp. M2MS4P-6 TaxID=2983762 RepID=UPI0021E40BA3|nr:diguanylate cyclase [Actinotalea sp. M2MS4P-6]MCV2394962.1 diguanylate cyclase [Actinotalea sp. M2MS4P-6]